MDREQTPTECRAESKRTEPDSYHWHRGFFFGAKKEFSFHFESIQMLIFVATVTIVLYPFSPVSFGGCVWAHDDSCFRDTLTS